MIFGKAEKFNAEILKQSWRVLYENHVEHHTYIELAKLVDEQKVSLSTRVTRRNDDYVGVPIGELTEFTPVFFSQVKGNIAPPHTRNSNVRSFFRVEDTREVFLKFNDRAKYCFMLKSFGAGGASFKSKDLIAAKHFVELDVVFTALNFSVLNGETFSSEGTLIDFFFHNGDYIYTFQFKNLASKIKVKTDRQCYEHIFEKSSH